MDLAAVTITLFAVAMPRPPLDYTSPFAFAIGIASVCGLILLAVVIRRPL